jgi:arsenate reductase
MPITIYHNPKCGTSRNVLGYLQEQGHKPHVIEYLKTPPSRDELKRLIKQMGVPIADVVRWKEPVASEIGLSKSSSDEEMLDAMIAHPILMNRPIVVTGKGAKLCRPSETVQELLG